MFNGVVQVRWDLMDERGSRYTNEAFNTAIQVTLPGSGRSHGLRGICTEALDAHGLSGTASGVHFLPT
jgi:hypothetical protein